MTVAHALTHDAKCSASDALINAQQCNSSVVFYYC